MIVLKNGEQELLKLPLLKELQKKEISYPLPMDIKDQKGVYFLFDNSNLCYVGKCISLRNRLTTHLTSCNIQRVNERMDKARKTLQFYSFIEFNDKALRDVAEVIYIFIYKPILNIL